MILQTRDNGEIINFPVTGVTAIGEAVPFSINREYLIKALCLGFTKLEVFDPLTPVIFKKGGKRLIVALLRPDCVPPAPPSAANIATIPVEQEPSSSPVQVALTTIWFSV
jgi:hypothetical protein